MSAPLFDADAYTAGILGLFPTGDAWPRDPASMLVRLARCIAPTYARSHGRLNELLVDAFPATAVALLPEWEATLGLPDPCSGPAATIYDRQLQVIAKLVSRGGQSVAYFTKVAAALGYAITIQQFAPARYGRPNYGKPRYGRDWAHVWQVSTAALVVTPARYGTHRSGEPYATWNGALLRCVLERLAPAHTILLFNYAAATMTWGGAEGWDGTWAA